MSPHLIVFLKYLMPYLNKLDIKLKTIPDNPNKLLAELNILLLPRDMYLNICPSGTHHPKKITRCDGWCFSVSVWSKDDQQWYQDNPIGTTYDSMERCIIQGTERVIQNMLDNYDDIIPDKFQEQYWEKMD